jgi:hypothetical protein
MKSSTRIFLLTCLGASLLAPGLAQGEDAIKTSSPQAGVPDLQLVIQVTSLSDPMEARESAEQFAQVLDETFRTRRYQGNIEPVFHGDPDPNEPILEVRLLRWRIGPTSMPECTFIAVLTQGDMKTKLGEFSATDLMWNKSVSNSDQGEAMRRVAQSALRDLAYYLAEKHLVPGFPPPKAKP